MEASERPRTPAAVSTEAGSSAPRRANASGFALLLALGLVLTGFLALSLKESDDPSRWIVRAEDHVCGLSDPRMLSLPARVEYDHLLRSTAEWQELVRRGIDPDSARGIQLRARAADRVRAAAEIERVLQGHCSVWKRIRHADGREVPDLSAAVLRRLIEVELTGVTATAER